MLIGFYCGVLTKRGGIRYAMDRMTRTARKMTRYKRGTKIYPVVQEELSQADYGGRFVSSPRIDTWGGVTKSRTCTWKYPPTTLVCTSPHLLVIAIPSYLT
jgi:hypothetical protein